MKQKPSGFLRFLAIYFLFLSLGTYQTLAQSELAFSDLIFKYGYLIDTYWQADGKPIFAVSARPSRDIYILDETFNVMTQLAPSTDPILADVPPFGPQELVWSWNGDYLAVILGSGAGDYVQIWDMATLTPHTTMTGIFHELHWQPNGFLLAVAEEERGVIIYDTVQNRVLQELVLPAGAFADDLDWRPDGSQIAALNSQNIVRTWDIVTGVTEFALDFQIEGQRGQVAYTDIAWSPDGTQLALFNADTHFMEIWDTDTENQISSFYASASDILWTPRGIASYSWRNNGIMIWNPQTGDNTHIAPLNEQEVLILFKWNPVADELIYMIASLEDNTLTFEDLIRTISFEQS